MKIVWFVEIKVKMKVTKIQLIDYLNFKQGLVIDLTYPQNHPDKSKRGKPLEKICFIGQSGTGKTTLLNLIKFFAFEDSINPECLDQNQLLNENVGIEFLINNSYKCSKWSKGNPTEKEKIENLKNIELNYKGENGLTNVDCKEYIRDHFFKENKVKLIFFPFDSIRNFIAIESSQVPSYQEAIKKPEDDRENKSISKIKEEYINKKIWDFSIDNIRWVWEIVVDQIKEYEPGYFNVLNEFLVKSEKDKINQPKYYEEFKKWQRENENPLKLIAQKCIDNLISKFNLKVNLEIDFEKEKHRKSIRIQQLNDNKEVPATFLSTGTIQIISTSIPLSVLDYENAIILFDEPERSLFPDSQIGLISEYTKMGNNSQFFFATHSPIVASAFDPCERIVLDFDENGKIICSRGIAPEGDDPNDILHKDFGMPNILEKKGEEAQERYIELKTLIHAEKNKSKKTKLMKEYMDIGNKYEFNH